MDTIKYAAKDGGIKEIKAYQGFWSERDVSTYTAMSCSWLRKKRERGEGIPFYKLDNGSIRYAIADVIRYMEQSKQTFTGQNHTH